MSSLKVWSLVLICAVLAMLALSWGVGLHARSSSAGGEGELAPELSIQTRQGVRKLSQLRGKVVLIDFWATWCGPCRQSIPMIQQLYKENQSRGFDVMGVALERGPGTAIPEFVHDMGITYPVGQPMSSAEAMKYRPDGIPLMVLVDRQGRIRWRQNGYSPDVDIRLVDQIERLLKE